MKLAKYIGLPYKVKGRGYDGADCWGLVCLYYRDELGILLPHYDGDYAHSEDRMSVSAAVQKYLPNWIHVEQPRHGDLLVFNILGLPIHTGIYIGCNNFLHAFKNTHSCIERLNSINWDRRLEGAYRWAQS